MPILLLTTFIYALLDVALKNFEGIPYFTQIAGRLLIALVFVAIFYWQSLRDVTRKDWLLGFLRGSLFSIFGGCFYLMAIAQNNIGIVALVTTLPYEYLLAVLILREKFELQKATGLFIATIGALFFIFDLDSFGINFSIIYAFISGAIWGLAVILARWHSPALSNAQMNQLSLIGGLTASSLLALLLEPQGLSTISTNQLPWFLACGLLIAIGGQLLNYLARTRTFAELSLYFLLIPVQAALLGVWFFAEQYHWSNLPGAALIVVGIIYFNYEKPLSASKIAQRG